MHRPWYYTHVFADPGHADTVYVTNLQMWKSTDGGASFTEVTTPHGDNHDLWIDPNATRSRMIEGNDGGANVSHSIQVAHPGRRSTTRTRRSSTGWMWTTSTPTESTAPSRTTPRSACPAPPNGASSRLGDCTYPGTGESGLHRRDPRNPNIVYMRRRRLEPGRRRRAAALRPCARARCSWSTSGPRNRRASGAQGPEVPLRLDVSASCSRRHDPGTLYAGGNCVFRTQRRGHASWQAISPDLSLNDRAPPAAIPAASLTHDTAGAEVHATCACLASESPHIASARSGPPPTTAWCMSRATMGKQLARTSRPSRMPEARLRGLCRGLGARRRRPMYVSRHALQAGRLPALPVQVTRDGGKSWKLHHRRPCRRQRDHARVMRADSGAPWPAVSWAPRPACSSSTFDDGAALDADDRRLPGGSGVRPEDQGQPTWWWPPMAARSGSWTT